MRELQQMKLHLDAPKLEQERERRPRQRRREKRKARHLDLPVPVGVSAYLHPPDMAGDSQSQDVTASHSTGPQEVQLA